MKNLNMAKRESSTSSDRLATKLGFVAVVGCLVAIAIYVCMIDSVAFANPNSRPSNIADNEASAVGSVRTLNTAAVTYFYTYPSLGYPASIAALGPAANGGKSSSAAADFIEPVLASGTKDGYKFIYTPSTTAPPIKAYTIVAVPISTSTGKRKFFTDESGLIRETTDGSTPTVASPPLR